MIEMEELEVLKEFRELVSDLHQTDDTLKRFLRARNHDLDKAEDMLRKSIQWRRRNKVDEILSLELDTEIVQACAIEYPGPDRRNQVIMSIPLGSWPLREMLDKGQESRMFTNIYIQLETLAANIVKSGEELFTLVLDMEGMTFWGIGRYDIISMILKVFRDFEANYPERLYEALVIYSPYAMNYLFPLVKPLLTGKTLAKVKFLGSDCRQFIPQLLEQIPPSSLPKKIYRLMQLNKINLADS